MMIGAGVFIGMGICISEAGPGGLILTFALNGLLAMFTAMSFAELSSAIPRAGGVYNFARISFGRGASFIAGWMEWFASSVAGAMYALAFSIYTIRYMKAIGLLGWLLNVFNISDTASIENTEFWFLKIIAVITALAFLYINFRGASETGKIGAIITIGQTIFVVAIGIIGVIVTIKDPTRLENFTPFLPEGWARILATMGFTYVAFEGYEVIAQAGDETIEPRKNLPKAMIYSVLIVTIIYVLVAFATVVSVKAGSAGVTDEPWRWIGTFREKGFGEAVTRLMPFGNFVLTLAVIFSSTSALNATIYSATRASYALGRDRMMPKLFSKIHSRNKTPYGALLATAVIVLIVATILPTQDVASSASIMFLFLFFMVNICVIKIRRSMADELTYGFIMPLFPLFPLLAIILQVFLAVWLIHMSFTAWIIAPIWIILGIIIYNAYSKHKYNAYSKHNAITTEEEILVLEEEKIRESDKYRIMVAVANPDNALQLVDSTYRICGAKDAQVELIHMVPVPDQVALRDAERYLEPGKEGLVEAMLYLSIHFPLSTTIRYCRNIARGIVSAIRQKKTKLLVLGWHGRPSGRLFNIGSTIDPIIEQSPCNVVVIKDCDNKKFNSTLVPLGGGPNSSFALEIASILTEDTGRITALTVETGKYQFDLNKFLDDEAMRLKIPRSRFEGKTIKAKNTINCILTESKEHELVVIGNTNKPLWRQITRQSFPEQIACRCGKPTVIVKTETTVTSWIKRWI
jgi:amino acid transporter/nucleotide-binding universal stress UspA family protein